MLSFFKTLANKKFGTRRRIREFKLLFGLEIYTSLAGVVCTLLWYFIAISNDPSVGLVGNYFYSIAILFGVIFGLGLAAGFALMAQLEATEPDTNGDHPYDQVVRWQVTGLTSANALVFGALVWVTGGALSALLPLYAMTFTMTISETKAPRPTSIAFAYFLLIFMVACYLYPKYDVVPWAVLAKLNDTTNFYIIFVMLSFASLFVPYTAMLFSWYTRIRPEARNQVQ